MSKQRTLWPDRLKAESVPEYIQQHQQVWPELEAAYRQAYAMTLDTMQAVFPDVLAVSD